MQSELISYGGGVNSVALTVLLVNEGWRGPIVFADTGTEWPETTCYLEYFDNEWLAPRGLSITRLGSEWRTTEYESPLINYCEWRRMIPLAAVRWCTGRYKIDPIAKWAKAHGIETEILGISAEESHRKPQAVRPLVDRWITRQGCVDLIRAEGLDVPQRSRCYICPFQRDADWHELWSRHPDLFERAAQLEEGVVRRNGEGKWQATLDYAGQVTLRDRQRRFEGQLMLFDDEDWSGLLAYQPCVCGL